MVLHLINLRTNRSFLMFDNSLQIFVVLLHLLMMTSALIWSSGLNNIGHYFEDFLCPKPIFGEITSFAAWIKICLYETLKRWCSWFFNPESSAQTFDFKAYLHIFWFSFCEGSAILWFKLDLDGRLLFSCYTSTSI